MNKSFFAKAAGSALIAASLFAATSANATVLTFDGESASFSRTIGPGTASFHDEYLFDVPAMSSADPFGTVAFSANRAGSTVKDTAVQFFRINADNSHTSLQTTFDASGFYLTAQTLSSGHYGFDVSGGIKNIAKGGSYGGTLTMNVSPVPEPTTYGMLLVGLGLLGFTARRKSNAKFH